MLRTLHLMGVHQHEAPCTVGVLHLPWLKARLPYEGSLLIAKDSCDGNTGERRLPQVAVDLAARADLRKNLCGDIERCEHLSIPLQRLDIHQLRPACVRHIGDM